MTFTNRIVNEKCHQLELENQQLGEQLKRLSGLNAVANTLVNKLKAEIRQLQEEKEVQIEEKATQMKVKFVVFAEPGQDLTIYGQLCFVFFNNVGLIW